MYLSVYLSIYLPPSLSLSLYLSIYLSIYLSVYLSIYLSTLQRTLFQDLILQKWHEWRDLEMRFAPHWPALFRHPNFQKWSRCFNILTSKRASRHSDVHFSSLIWPDGSARDLRPCRATNHWKNWMFQTFLAFRAPVSFFYSSLLSDSSHLYIVGSFTSKVPLMNHSRSLPIIIHKLESRMESDSRQGKGLEGQRTREEKEMRLR